MLSSIQLSPSIFSQLPNTSFKQTRASTPVHSAFRLHTAVIFYECGNKTKHASVIIFGLQALPCRQSAHKFDSQQPPQHKHYSSLLHYSPDLGGGTPASPTCADCPRPGSWCDMYPPVCSMQGSCSCKFKFVMACDETDGKARSQKWTSIH